jgi:hypothetical protein
MYTNRFVSFLRVSDRSKNIYHIKKQYRYLVVQTIQSVRKKKKNINKQCCVHVR